MSAHHCHARNCETRCPPEYLMCPKHWRMVPIALQREVWKHYRPGQCDDMRPSREWHVAADAAIAAVFIQERENAARRTGQAALPLSGGCLPLSLRTREKP